MLCRLVLGSRHPIPQPLGSTCQCQERFRLRLKVGPGWRLLNQAIAPECFLQHFGVSWLRERPQRRDKRHGRDIHEHGKTPLNFRPEAEVSRGIWITPAVLQFYGPDPDKQSGYGSYGYWAKDRRKDGMNLARFRATYNPTHL